MGEIRKAAVAGRGLLFVGGVVGVSAVSFLSSAAAGYGIFAVGMAVVRRSMRNR